MKTLSIQRPRPSIEILMPAPASMPVKAALVNWLPWSVLKISGLPKRASASSSAETQNEHVHGVRQPPCQHRAARPVDHRYQIEEAPPDRNVGDVGRPYLVRPIDRQVAQQIGEDLVARRRLASSAASVPAPQSPSCASAAARACG